MLQSNNSSGHAPRVNLRFACLAALLATLGLCRVAAAQISETYSHTETFDTTDHMDPDETTAFWNVTGGVLTLPTAISRLDTLDIGYSGRAVTVSGKYAYVAAGNSGLRVVDTSDPTTPTEVGSLTFGATNPVSQVAVDGDYAVICYTPRSGPGNWRVVDVSDPTNPESLSGGSRPNSIGDIALEGDLCLMAQSYFGLSILDLTDPEDPTNLSYGLVGDGLGVDLQGRYAYVVGGDYLEVVNVANPYAATQAGLLSIPGARAVAVAGHHAYVLAGSELCVVDISEPTSPALVTAVPSVWGYAITIAGNWAYVSAAGSGLHMYDISDPTAPLHLLHLETDGYAAGCAVTGNLLHVVGNPGTLSLYEIADLLTPPVIVDSYPIPDDATDVAVAGDLALVTAFGAVGADPGNLHILDITDPESPSTLSIFEGFPVDCKAVAVAMAGDRAYVLTDFEDPTFDGHSSVLHTIDISDPTSPIETDSIGFMANAEARTITLRGNYAYCGCRTSGVNWGIIIIDVSDPDNLAIAGHANTLDHDVYDIEIAGNCLFLAEPTGSSNEKLQVMDITDPAAPTPAWNGYLTFGVSDVGIVGNYLSIIDLTYYVFDIDDPFSPAYETSLWAPNIDFRSMEPAGRYMALDTNDGFALADLNTPTAPVLLPEVPHPGNIRDIAVQGDYAYGAANRFYSGSYSGLHVFRIFDHKPDVSRNRGQSLTLDNLPLDVHTARITAVDQGTVNWYLSADGGAHWEPVQSGDDWHAFVYPGSDLRWRAQLVTPTSGDWPIAETLTVEWNHLDASAAGAPPSRFALRGSAPNPFNARTTIGFEVPIGGGEVLLEIYNLRGQQVRRLVEGFQEEGIRRVPWDGRDDHGRRLAGGIYYCRMSAAGYEETSKLSFVP